MSWLEFTALAALTAALAVATALGRIADACVDACPSGTTPMLDAELFATECYCRVDE